MRPQSIRDIVRFVSSSFVYEMSQTTTKSKRIVRPLPTLPGEPAGRDILMSFFFFFASDPLLRASCEAEMHNSAHADNGISRRATTVLSLSLRLLSHPTDRQRERRSFDAFSVSLPWGGARSNKLSNGDIKNS